MQVLTESAEYSEVGAVHNIVANDETGYVYIVGANNTRRIPEEVDNKFKDMECKGKLSHFTVGQTAITVDQVQQLRQHTLRLIRDYWCLQAQSSI